MKMFYEFMIFMKIFIIKILKNEKIACYFTTYVKCITLLSSKCLAKHSKQNKHSSPSNIRGSLVNY